MKITMLGSGGATPIPRPTCGCRLCSEALTKGIPYSRTGTSLFLHDLNLLFDTPEEIRLQLTRERIPRIDNVILTHWHPDHTHGIRVLEEANWNFAEGKSYFGPINLYISKLQHELMRKFTCGSFLDYYDKKGIIKLNYLEDKESINSNGVKVTPFLIEKTKGFYYLIEDGQKKIIYAPCEYHEVQPDENIKDVDIFIVHNLFWENSDISPRKSRPADEDSFETILKHANLFGAKNIILTHIEESFGLNHDELNEKMKKYYPNFNIVAGHDGLLINI